ncbi:MFS transporter [Streptomyces sp. NPDC046161]|uniref:MFS transporter n=1 Tax=Streptomyces sp. NPDC046161 TaxID=3155132 RepID=UPI0033D3AF71
MTEDVNKQPNSVRAGSSSPTRRWLSAATVCSGLFLLGMDLTILNVAVPDLRNALGSSMGQTQWIVDAYALVLGGTVLTSGSLTDRIGRRRAFTLGLAVCGLASLAGALAATPQQVIAARAGMGAGASLLMPATLSLISALFPEEALRNRAIALWAAVGGLGGACGPVLGGWLVSEYSWRAVFWLNVPFAAAVITLTVLVIPACRARIRSRIDVPGTVCSALGLLVLVWSVIEAPTRGWSSPAVLAGFATAGLLLAAFVVWLRRAPTRMIARTALRRPVAVAAGALAMMSFGMFGALFVISLYLQGVMGCDPWQAGVRTLPLPGALIAGAGLAAALAGRWSQKSVMLLGLALVAFSFAVLGSTGTSSGYGHLVAVQVIAGTGAGLTAAAGTGFVMALMTEEHAGLGSAINDATRQVGATLGVAIQGSVLATAYTHRMTEEVHRLGTPHLSGPAVDNVIAAAQAGRNLPPEIRSRLLGIAEDAFVMGMSRAAWVAGVVAVAALLAVWRWLPPGANETSGRRQPPARAIALTPRAVAAAVPSPAAQPPMD